MLQTLSRLRTRKRIVWESKKWRHLRFDNPLGISGGVDKNADMVRTWWRFGLGFVEVGTITPRAQGPNPGKILDRRIRHHAVWNRMGFPSKGLSYAKAQLTSLKQPHFTPIFANIGKNRETPLRSAADDYIKCIRGLDGLVDGFVINISSPNTSGLRNLLESTNLKNFMSPVVEANRDIRTTMGFPMPLILKLSPDLDNEQLDQVLDVSIHYDIDGWVISNTSTELYNHVGLPQEGGVSGQPLAEKAEGLLRKTIVALGDDRQDRLVVSSGGVMTPEDVFRRLQLGADLVQVYSTLIFNGPWFFCQTAKAYRSRNKAGKLQ